MTEQQTVYFVIAVLYRLDKKWRGIGNSSSFEDILENRHGVNLHAAWFRMKIGGLLGEFAPNFYFDSLHDTSNLRAILRTAYVPHGLVRLDGTEFDYHLDAASLDVIDRLVRRQNISTELIEEAAKKLNHLLEIQAEQAKCSS